MCDLPDRDLDTNIFRRFRIRPHLRARRSGIDAVFATRYLDATMTRFNLVLALIAVLALAFADPARAMGDHDHASPAADSATDSPWACTAVCTADANTNVRSSPASLDPRDLPRIPVCLNRSARVGSPAPTRGRTSRVPDVISVSDNADANDVNPEPLFLPRPAQHPCGAGNYVAREPYKTCALTQTAIMAVDEYKTAEHVVACPSAVCETKCTASGAASGFHCFNTSVLMDHTAEEANERALAMGCVGSHRMGNMSMAGATHGDCLKGHNHNDYMATAGAPTTFKSVVVAVVVALAAIALA